MFRIKKIQYRVCDVQRKILTNQKFAHFTSGETKKFFQNGGPTSTTSNRTIHQSTPVIPVLKLEETVEIICGGKLPADDRAVNQIKERLTPYHEDMIMKEEKEIIQVLNRKDQPEEKKLVFSLFARIRDPIADGKDR